MRPSGSDIGDPERETEIVIEPTDEPVPSVLPIEEPVPAEVPATV